MELVQVYKVCITLDLLPEDSLSSSREVGHC